MRFNVWRRGRFSIFLLILILCLGMLPIAALAQETPENGEAVPEMVERVDLTGTDYAAYLQKNVDITTAKLAVQLSAAQAILTGGVLQNEYEGISQVALLDAEATMTWQLSLPNTAQYAVVVEYASRMADNRQYDLNVMINGKTPYDEASELVLHKRWHTKTAENTLPDRIFKLDSYGNELTDSQSELQGWQTAALYDSEGKYNEKLLFALASGDEFTISFTSGYIAVSGVTLMPVEELPDYATVLESYQAAGYTAADGQSLVLQAEMPQYVSDPMINATFDHLSVATQPQDAYRTLMNTIGKTYWQYTGQSITYAFTVKHSGLYKIDLRVRQNFQRGVQVGRRIKLDGLVPFKELDNYRFAFSDRWSVQELGNNEEPYLFYLEAGKHTLSMDVVTAYPGVILQMQQVQLELNDFYRQILMIVGSDPDPYRDYMLTDAIPDFREQLETYRITLENLLNTLYISGFEKGGEVVTVEELADQIAIFIEDPDKTATQLSTLKDNLAALGTWMLTLTQQPLELDYIGIIPSDALSLKNEETFFDNFLYGFKVFLASFVVDYTTLDDSVSKEPLEVWANVGRDQAQIIKRLVDNEFEEMYDIDVKFNLVQQALIPATLSGKGPDVAIMVSPTDVINLSVRDALVPLNQFSVGENISSFEEVKDWFQPASTALYSYEGKTYGLPMDEQFFMMFYRRDVLQELGLAVPTTWEEMNKVISVLARNYLSVGIPSGANEVMFQTLLMQHGGSYYVDGWKHTGLNSDSAVAAFRQWTEFFTKYSLPVEYDPYSRFRSGEMPIVINYYTFYNTLYSSAPEIKGLWEMAPIPGVVQEDGSVNQTSMGTGTAVVLFKKAQNYDAGWTFMQWLVSSDTQSKYASEVESIMGVAGRYNTANIEAFKNIAWKKSSQQQLLKQWEQMQIVQMTPVSYYYTRNVTNAFRKAVYSSVNPREALGSYARDIEKEIQRKRKIFGLV